MLNRFLCALLVCMCTCTAMHKAWVCASAGSDEKDNGWSVLVHLFIQWVGFHCSLGSAHLADPTVLYCAFWAHTTCRHFINTFTLQYKTDMSRLNTVSKTWLKRYESLSKTDEKGDEWERRRKLIIQLSIILIMNNNISQWKEERIHSLINDHTKLTFT